MGIYLTTVYLFHGSSDNKSLKKMDFAIDIARCIFPYFIHQEMGAITIAIAVKNLNDDVAMVINDKLDPYIHVSGRFKPIVKEEFCKNPGALKTKTLLIDTSYALSKKSTWVKDFQAYKYKYRFLPLTEIATLLSSADSKNYCIVNEGNESYFGGLEIYDFETKSKIWSGNDAPLAKEIAELNSVLARSK